MGARARRKLRRHFILEEASPQQRRESPVPQETVQSEQDFCKRRFFPVRRSTTYAEYRISSQDVVLAPSIDARKDDAMRIVRKDNAKPRLERTDIPVRKDFTVQRDGRPRGDTLLPRVSSSLRPSRRSRPSRSGSSGSCYDYTCEAVSRPAMKPPMGRFDGGEKARARRDVPSSRPSSSIGSPRRNRPSRSGSFESCHDHTCEATASSAKADAVSACDGREVMPEKENAMLRTSPEKASMQQNKKIMLHEGEVWTAVDGSACVTYSGKICSIRNTQRDAKKWAINMRFRDTVFRGAAPNPILQDAVMVERERYLRMLADAGDDSSDSDIWGTDYAPKDVADIWRDALS